MRELSQPIRVLAVGCLLAVAMGAARAQPAPIEGGKPDDQVEAYLERLGLQRLTAEQLAIRLVAAAKEERVPLAERLGKLYVHLLTQADSDEQSRLWEQRGRDLLRDVPEADTSELRLNLNKAVYLRVEEIVERGRLRLAEPAEMQEADRQLRALTEQFGEIALRSHRRVETLERIESSGDATEALVTELGDARRIRSLAYYFAGWCNYYVSYIGGSEQHAQESLKCFGWLLNSPAGRPATIDRLPRELLRYEHIARAAMGCGLASGLRGNDAEAVRWLDEVGNFPELPATVRDQLLIRRMIVLSSAKRWADLERLVRQTRRPEGSSGAARTAGSRDNEPLAVGPSRLLAVATLEADRRIAGSQIEALARTALGDLVARQQIGQVLDLVRRYGTDSLGDTGFIVHYVRGLIQYDQARKAHRAEAPAGVATTEVAEDPTSNPEVVNLYSAAASMLDAAIRQSDAESFKADLVKAAVMLGRCRFYSGNLGQAGDQFLAAWESGGRAEGGEATEEALWLAIVTFDRAARLGGDGAAVAERKRSEAAILFLSSYPESPRAAKIVLMQAAGGGDVAERDAIRILLDVPKESPVYEPARRQVARLLYNTFRSARGTERDSAAMRFIAVAEELLASDRDAAMGQDRAIAASACDRLVTRARQMLDVLLGGSSPDAGRAAAVLELLNGVVVYNKLDLSKHEAELLFRRIQIALATSKDEEATALAEQLTSLPAPARGGEYIAAADRLIYKRFVSAWKQEGAGASDATVAGVIRFGRRVIEKLGPEAGSLQDPAVQALYSNVAAAATRRAQSGDTEARELAIALDESLLKAAPRSEEALRRLAANAEAAGRAPLALDCWNVLFAAAAQASPEWFEARYESLRLLMGIDKAKASDLLEQHRLLYPDFGPSPWGDKLRELDAAVPDRTSPAATPPTGSGSPPPPTGGGQ